MASEAEIERIRKDKGQWGPLLQRLSRHVDDETLAERHVCLLESLAERTWLDELSYRQAEWLLDIRDDVTLVSSHRDVGVQFMTRYCYENRFGLDDYDDCTWVIRLFDASRPTIRRDEARRLYGLYRELNDDVDD